MSQTIKQHRTPFFYSIVNPVLNFLVLRFDFDTRGDQDVLRILRVRGRRSGRTYELPVRIASMNGRRYLMSMLGESQWVHNLRAAGRAELLAGKEIESVRVEEISGKEKASFFIWYCRHPQYAQRARYGLKADVGHLTSAEIDRLARLYPVFRLENE